MKTQKMMIGALTALLIGGLAFTACQHEELKQPAAAQSPDPAIVELVALGEKMNPTEAEMAHFQQAYAQLTLDELIQYRQVQYEKIRREHGRSASVEARLTQDLAWFKEVNQRALKQFGRTANRLASVQLDQLFAEKRVGAAANGRAASCPKIYFNTTFTRGNGGTTNLRTVSAREVEPEDQGDCDCQVAFATSNTNFRRLKPLNGTASGLLNDIGNTLGGRQLTGQSAGSYPVWGKGRLMFWYPQAAFYGCNVLLQQYTLSNQ